MKAIKKRAKEFVKKSAGKQVIPDYINELLELCYCTGAEEERKLLTEWHSPDEHPKSGLTVLIKYIDIRFPNQSFFTTGVYYSRTRQWCAGYYGKYTEVVGWREIHD